MSKEKELSIEVTFSGADAEKAWQNMIPELSTRLQNMGYKLNGKKKTTGVGLIVGEDKLYTGEAPDVPKDIELKIDGHTVYRGKTPLVKNEFEVSFKGKQVFKATPPLSNKQWDELANNIKKYI